MQIKQLLFIAILLLLCFPYLQRELKVVDEKPISGYFKPVAEPSFDSLRLSSWKTGKFQEDYISRLTNHLGFRSGLLRINNQVDYSLFGLTHTEGYIKGKERKFLQEEYISEYLGTYFIGRTALQQKLQKLRSVSDSLRSNGIGMLLVLEPSKVICFPEDIPPRFLKSRNHESNYSFISKRLNTYGISHIDMSKWFRMMRDTSRLPLFSPYGMHWSVYGEFVSLDTLMRGLEKVSGKVMPHIKISSMKFSDSLWQTDNDIGRLLNLALDLKKISMPYPILHFNREGTDTSARVLIIADSYYETMLRDVKEPLFAKSEFWFYNSKLFPFIDDYHNPVYIDKDNLISKYIKFNVILLMTSDINMHAFLWDFIEEAWAAFHPGITDQPVYKWENSIRKYPDWFKSVIAKASKYHRPLELQIRAEAQWMTKQEAK